MYKYLRPKFPIKVECWFCEKVTEVPYGNKNCWDCPDCEQYNGFGEDGNYNKPIPAQFNESMNYPVNCKTDEFISKDSILCDECNQNQLLKVRQLSAFVPFNENKFDAEIEAYEQHLEHVYRLCEVCQGNVKMELHKQDNVLGMNLDKVRASMSKSSQIPFNEKVSQRVHVTSFLYKSPVPLSVLMTTVSSVCAFTLCVTHIHTLQKQRQTWLPTSYLLPAIQLAQRNFTILGGLGILTSIFAKMLVGKNRLHVVDAVNIQMWILTALVDSQIGQSLFGSMPVVSFIHHSLNTFMGLLCLLVSRRSRSEPNITIKRKSLDSSDFSHGSENKITDNSPIRSVSEASYRPMYDHSPCKLQQNTNNMDDALSDLGSFCIGSAKRRSPSGVFGCSSFTSGETVLQTGFSFYQATQDRKNRPLISPAKLQVTQTSQNRPDNPFLQKKRETSMMKVDCGTNNLPPSHTYPTQILYSDKPSIFADNVSNGEIPNEEQLNGRNFNNPLSKLNCYDCGSTVSGHFSCNGSTRKIWSVHNHPINHIEKFEELDSRSTTSSVCPVDSTTKSELKATAFWRSPGFIGFVMGASLVGNIFLSFNSWNSSPS